MKRGWDGFVRIPYAEAYALHAKALENITRTYSGEQGKQYLLAQGYDPAMVDAMAGAGVRTIKVRGGMAKLGATRIVGTYRFGNMLALLDAAVRGVGADRGPGRHARGIPTRGIPTCRRATRWCTATRPRTSSSSTSRTPTWSSSGA